MLRRLSILCLLLTAACSYQVDVAPAPALNVYTSNTQKITGKFALYVDAGQLNQSITTTGYICGGMSYPVQAADVFKDSTAQTLRGLVEGLDIVDAPLTKDQLAARSYRGLITVRVDHFDALTGFAQNEFTAATAIGTANLTVGMLVDGPTDRLFGTSVSADRRADRPSESCGTGADVISAALTEAIENVQEQLAEHLSEAPKLRQTASVTGN